MPRYVGMNKTEKIYADALKGHGDVLRQDWINLSSEQQEYLRSEGFYPGHSSGYRLMELPETNREPTFLEGLLNPDRIKRASTEPEAIKRRKDDDSTRARKAEVLRRNVLLPPSYHRLERMIGLDSVKNSMLEIIDMVAVQKARRGYNLPAIDSSLHLVFTGNPGTGKTVVARIIADIFKEIGALESGHLVEVGRKDLVGRHIGKTAPLVQKAVNSAMGGVLFIDEAYSLIRDLTSTRDFGREAIDTLVPLMENHRDSFAVIVAGYKNEMDTFLDGNPGLKSRFPITLHFEDYSLDELFSIFQSFCDSMKLSLGDGATLKVKQRIAVIREESGKDFGNGREMRNLLTKCLKRQASRLATSKSYSKQSLMTLTEADIPEEVES